MLHPTRREMLGAALAGAASVAVRPSMLLAQAPVGPTAPQDPSVKILHPLARVPLSFIIDDSSCLVNIGHFCMPQFAEAWPSQVVYRRPWKDWPREIPDSFLRTFGEWCAQHGVKGKYSVVPNPACVGWLDRELPGWSKKELRDSIKLVRDVIVPNWDIHPEMITHTRVIDLKTGRPFEEISPATMENSYPQTRKSADELAAYIAYALQILKNCEIPCEGITTPGGFGNQDKSALALGIRQAVSDVFRPEVPHYFKYISGGNESTEPKLEHVQGLDTDHPRFIVNIPAGTGDWFGGWEGDRPSQPDKYATADATGGRMVELIERGVPAVMFCHWPGLYSNGALDGFNSFKRIINSLHARFRDQIHWMKLNEIARYWAAKGLTRIERVENRLELSAPVATPAFTLEVPFGKAPPTMSREAQVAPLREVKQRPQLQRGTWMAQQDARILCFDLARGKTTIEL